MRGLRGWALPVLLVLNGLLGLAIAERAGTLRRAWQTYELRRDAQARLKNLHREDDRPRAPQPEAP